MGVEENKATVQMFYDEVLNRGNLDVIDKMTAENYVDHTAPPGMPPGREGEKQWFTMLRAAFPDGQTTIDDIIADVPRRPDDDRRHHRRGRQGRRPGHDDRDAPGRLHGHPRDGEAGDDLRHRCHAVPRGTERRALGPMGHGRPDAATRRRAAASAGRGDVRRIGDAGRHGERVSRPLIDSGLG